MTAAVTIDVNGCFAHAAGPEALDRSDLDALAARAAAVLADIEARRAGGDLAYFDQVAGDEAVEASSALAATLAGRFDRLVVLGIGGSALGTRAVLDSGIECDAGGLDVEVADNVDPRFFRAVMDRAPLERTVFNVISKSGGTAETMAQYLVVRSELERRFGERWCEHVVVTTDPEHGPLRALASAENLPCLDVPAGVGGRFSVLTNVGLFPLAAAGVDVRALLAGARAMDRRTREPAPWRNPAALHAAALFLGLERGRNVHVLMPYSNSLVSLCEWYAQMWAESLGKRHALDGSKIECGQTPVRALGATDQHSQVQLYVEGPHDKVVTFVRVESHGEDVPIPDAPGDLAYLGGHDLGALLNMEQTATEMALSAAGRWTTRLTVERVDAHALGELFHLFAVQTLVMGGLLGVDPLDQPGVELGKRLTRALAGDPAHGEAAADIEARLAARHDDLVLG